MDLPFADVTRLLDGGEEPIENNRDPLIEDHHRTNNLDLTGIAYDFPEDEQNTGTTLENALELVNLDEQMPPAGVDAGSNDDVQIEDNVLEKTFDQLASLEDFMGASSEPVEQWPEGASRETLLAMNEAYQELLTTFMAKVDVAINDNKEKQTRLARRIEKMREAGKETFRKVPVLNYLPPYFKDDSLMCPPLSSEARMKQTVTDYDPLMKEEKKWSTAEIQELQRAVREGLIGIHLEPHLRRKREIEDLMKSAGQEVDKAEMDVWKDELESIDRKVDYSQVMTMETLLTQADQRNIDWTSISNINFNGRRTAQALELKWINEVAPRWNHGAWTEEEIKKLTTIREEDRFVSWAALADRMGTRRTAWECFCKYKRDIQQQTKEWTQAEDEKLLSLVSMMKMNGSINWDKVTYYMPGRNRQQVRVRYMRTLDKNVKHGKWTEQEDLLLMCAVNRLGAQDWSKIAKTVEGRTDTQCRERWVNVLDRRVHPKEWDVEEDEKLLFLMSVLGNNAWSKCASFLSGRSGDQCRYRYQSLMNSKIRLCTAKNISSKDIGTVEYNSRFSLKKTRVDAFYQTPKGRGRNDVHEDMDGPENPPKRMKLSDDDRQALDEELLEIELRHIEGKGAGEEEILDSIQISQSDLNDDEETEEQIIVDEQEDSDLSEVSFSGDDSDSDVPFAIDHDNEEGFVPGPSSATIAEQAKHEMSSRKRKNSAGITMDEIDDDIDAPLPENNTPMKMCRDDI